LNHSCLFEKRDVNELKGVVGRKLVARISSARKEKEFFSEYADVLCFSGGFREFVCWRQRMGFSRKELDKALGYRLRELGE
jgi:hypothetical protein